MCIQYHSQRTAKYDAEDGSWSGVQNPPPRIAAYKSAVEGVVAQSIRAAMKSLLSPKKPALKLTTMGADPETALTNEIAKATHQAVDEELTVGSAGKAVAKLKARRAKSILKSVRSKLGQQLHSAPVKTIKGCMCRQTYVFRGRVHSGCIRLGGERGWCFTVANCGDNFEAKGKASFSWDHCEPELIRTVKGSALFIFHSFLPLSLSSPTHSCAQTDSRQFSLLCTRTHTNMDTHTHTHICIYIYILMYIYEFTCTSIFK